MDRYIAFEMIMIDYRLYMMDRGHIRAAHDLEAASDAEACARADELRAGQPAELWRRDRLIMIFPTAYERTG